MLLDCLDGAHCERGANAERHGAGIPHFERGNAKHRRQTLPAKFLRP